MGLRESEVTPPTSFPAFGTESSLGLTLASGLQIQCSFQESTLHPLSRAGIRAYPLCTSLDVPVSASCLVITGGVIGW